MRSDKAQTFKFHNIELRTVLIDGEPWFVLKDAASAMGLASYGDAGYAPHAQRLDANTKKTLNKKERPNSELWCGRAASLIVISESGLYKLVMRSDKAQAKEFQGWVTGTEQAPNAPPDGKRGASKRIE